MDYISTSHAKIVLKEREIMKIKVDSKTDALYFRLDESKIIESEEVSPGIILDFNDQDQVVGIEILNLSKRSEKLNLHSFHYEAV